MSELKSPFLEDKEVLSEEKIHGVNNDKIPNSNEGGVVVDKKELTQGDVNMTRDDIKSENDNEEASLEIEEDGKMLRRIIIILIVLLIIALLGLFLYNALNKKNNVFSNEAVKQGDNLNITDFDMRGEEFQARSIIIE